MSNTSRPGPRADRKGNVKSLTTFGVVSVPCNQTTPSPNSGSLGGSTIVRNRKPVAGSDLACSRDPHELPDLLPARRWRPLQLIQHQRADPSPLEDPLDDVRRQQRQPQDLVISHTFGSRPLALVLGTSPSVAGVISVERHFYIEGD